MRILREIFDVVMAVVDILLAVIGLYFWLLYYNGNLKVYHVLEHAWMITIH